MEEHMLPCMFKQTIGVDCIGCGIQRSFNFLIHGEFINAFNMFPAIYTTLLFFISIALFVFDKRHNYQKLVIYLALLNAVIMTVSYVYKMRILY